MRPPRFVRLPTRLLVLASLSIMPGILPTPAHATVGCHAATCIQRDDSGRYVTVIEVRIQTCQTGLPGYFHAHLTGPGIDRNSEELEITSENCGATRFQFRIDQRFDACTDIHTDGWKRESRRSDDYQNMGHPFITVADGCPRLSDLPPR
ncbi:hypothetical protein AW168_35835 [Nocardia brasiliensis]|uniref:Secreted protein n=1 Tax=Nocardia brasiliensis (strain ATCC 700358 / HUJEG-1) TaxID=1133849 RepID=K0F024_NOCB7|nr:hypothetical protein O3I_023670 [Nocardia brasiliensis ATCC 700358]OCF85633.1 hypothetical protein AW168_35835 [Nocardia brasiliensis]